MLCNKTKMISLENALSKVFKSLPSMGTEKVVLTRAAGRVLAKNIRATAPNPAWDNSGMDGYALRAGDTAGANKIRPVELRVIYKLPAGSVPQRPVGVGEAVRIMTGVPMPKGADAVAVLEETDELDGYVLIQSRIESGANVRKKGSDFRRGSLVLRRGTPLGPAEIGMIALIGYKTVEVFNKPRVAILSTGNELCGDKENPVFGKIPDCNSPALAAAVEGCGGLPIVLGQARDDRESIRKVIKKGLKAAECVVTSGGVSAGDYDFVGDVLGEMGGESASWKIAIKPGKPFAFGSIGGKPVFGLPGNTVSALMSFETFVRPALLKMSGRNEIVREYLYAELTEDITRNPERRSFLMSVLWREGPRLMIRPLPNRGSGMLKSLIDSNSMIIAPEGSGKIKKGAKVKVIPFNKFFCRVGTGRGFFLGTAILNKYRERKTNSMFRQGR